MKPAEIKRRELVSYIAKLKNKKKLTASDINFLKDAEYELSNLTKRK